MMFELVVWYEPAPVTVERAAATDVEAVEPHPGVAAFAEELRRVRPGADVTAPGSRHARVQGRLYRTRLGDLEEMRRAFQEYASGDRRFLERHSWTA
ncbi:hypothetical protein [Spirillospora albida]|uniref:hypothetical protein n=1 Tax=Spirillospora albida TaxID=58123 RepID=UPI0004BE625A|nr:hypothetical protein [Spirillospora albida]